MPGQGIDGYTALPTEVADDDLLVMSRANQLFNVAVKNVPTPWSTRKALKAPLVSDFPTTVNLTGRETITQLDDGVRLFVDRRAGDSIAAWLRPLPGGSWDIRAGFVKGSRHGGAQAGLIMRESGTGKLLFQSFGVNSVPGWFTSRYNNPTSFGAILINWQERGLGIAWFRFVKNGSNIDVKISHDGVTYKDMSSIAITTAFTTAPDQWGIYINGGNYLVHSWLDCIDWSE